MFSRSSPSTLIVGKRLSQGCWQRGNRNPAVTRIFSFSLGEGQALRQDIYFGGARILCTFTGFPKDHPGAVLVFKGEVDVPASFDAFEAMNSGPDLAGLARVDPANETTIFSLPAGTYTVLVYDMPDPSSVDPRDFKQIWK